MSQRPLILVTNDDGINAPGIRTLIRWMSRLGDVYVVAPDKPQSGMGHAITVNVPLYVEPINPSDGAIKEWSCSGTPADCVKLAKHELLPRKPDVCVSGINHGSNASINVIYSGTMSAAVEASLEGIPAVGVSLCNYSHDANFDAAELYIIDLINKVLDNPKFPKTALNVNIPDLPKEALKGFKMCHQGLAQWQEKFEKRNNPFGRPYYWLSGDFVDQVNDVDSDLNALEQGYISIVPVKHDLTDYNAIDKIFDWL